MQNKLEALTKEPNKQVSETSQQLLSLFSYEQVELADVSLQRPDFNDFMI